MNRPILLLLLFALALSPSCRGNGSSTDDGEADINPEAGSAVDGQEVGTLEKEKRGLDSEDTAESKALAKRDPPDTECSSDGGSCFGCANLLLSGPEEPGEGHGFFTLDYAPGMPCFREM